MNPKLTFLCFLVAALSLASTCFGQSDDAKISVQFVDTSGHRVNPAVALFFNGGRAKPITIENGIGVAPSDSGIVVAKADGFQFSGSIVDGNEIKVVFHRDDEPCKPLTQTPYPLNDEIKAKVVETTKRILWEKVEGQPASSMKTIQTLRVLAVVDPARALKWLDENEPPDQMGGMIQQPALTALVHVDPEEAFDRCSQIKDPMQKSAMLMFLLEALDPEDPAVPVLEAQWMETTRTVKQPAMRLAMRSAIGEYFQIRDRPELVNKIVQQHIEEVKKLPSAGWSAFPRSLFAALVVEEDPELAEELIKGNRDQNESNRAHARVAFSCCRTNPELATKLLSLCEHAENTISVWDEPIKVCHRMAVQQPEAARKLAGSIDELNQRSWALGLMAMKLSDSNPTLAKELLAEAIELLSEPEAHDQQWFPVGGTLAGLLPIAQKVDPTKVQPLMWQAVFEILPRTRWVQGTSNKIKIQSVAGAIARYDVELGRALVGKSQFELGNIFAESAVRQALLDPSRIVTHTEKVCSLDAVQRNHMMDKLADFVTQNENAFWNSISKPESLNWPTRKFEDF